MLQTLPRIPRPTGAVAVVNQGHCTQITQPPRGMTLNSMFVDKRTQHVPNAMAADHLGILLRGYLSTQTVMAAETPTEVPLMLAAEDCELRDAATSVQPPDNSLAPRPVAVTLLAYGNHPVHCNGARAYLDALGYLASTPLLLDAEGQPPAASQIRMTVLAGVDAQWFASEVKKQALETMPITNDGCIDVCVRWATQPTESVSLRSEFKQMQPGEHLDKSLEAMQNCFLSMKIAYNVPFPCNIAVLHPNVPNDAWAISVHNASKAFFELMNGSPCVYKGEVLKKHEGHVNVEATGLFVRICPRTTHDPRTRAWLPISLIEAKARPDAFHAFLIGNVAYKEDIVTLCKQHERIGLPPVDEESEAYCLHTCAVQANSFALNERVSLYATHHQSGGAQPGLPICSPGSWMWRFESAIVAIEHVLTNFYVVPCSRDSVMPGDRKLEKPFNDFFGRAYKLYTDTFGRGKPQQHGEFERLPILLPMNTDGVDPSVRAAEDYALTAFNIDASSRRVVVGDAYANLQARQAPSALTNFMLQSSLHRGINTSIVDALGLAAQALTTLQNAPTAYPSENSEVARLKRLADAAVNVSSKRRKSLSPVVEIEASKVKALLTAAGLRKGANCWIPKTKTEYDHYSTVVTVLSSVALKGLCQSNIHEHACFHAKNACERARKENRVDAELEALSAATTVLRASSNAMTGSIFVVAQRDDDDKTVSFNRILPGGTYETSSPGAIVDSPLAAVLLLKITPRAMRVTATVRE